MKEFGGKRYNKGKAPMELLVPEAMEAEANVWGIGAEKYGTFNWQKGMTYSTVLGCAMRHLTAILRGEDFDQESGLPHAAHVKTNMSMLIYYMQHMPECDDRVDTRKRETAEQQGIREYFEDMAVYSDVNDAEMDRAMKELSEK